MNLCHAVPSWPSLGYVFVDTELRCLAELERAVLGCGSHLAPVYDKRHLRHENLLLQDVAPENLELRP